MPRSETPSLFDEVPASPPARDEMNFAEFPMAVLSTRAPKDCFELVFSDKVSHKGVEVTRKLTLTSTPKYGLPTPKDEEVLLGLVSLTKRQNNFTDRTVYFTRHELLRLLGLNNEGHSYQRIEESLHRWAAVYLHYENAWWDNEAKSHTDVAFHVIDQWQMTKGEGKRGGRVVVKWNEVVLKSFRSNYVKHLDLGFYQSLESAVTKRLYRFLDKHLYRHPHRREFDLANLAYVHVGIMQSSPLFKAKQLIESASRELEERGYLEPVASGERFTKQARGKWTILFAKKVKELVEAGPESDADGPDLSADLVARGLSPVAARKALSKSPKVLLAPTVAEHVKLCLEAFDWAMARKDKPKKPNGYLYSLVTEGYLPDGFVPAAVLQKQADERNRELTEHARKGREQEAIRKAELEAEQCRRQRVDAFLASLPAEQRASIEERALRDGPAEDVEAYHKALASKLNVWAERCRYKLLHAVVTSLPQ